MIDLIQPWLPGVNLPAISVFVLLIVVTVGFFREWGPPDVVALCALGAIILLGLLPVSDVIKDGIIVERGLLSVFSNGAPITIAAMFVLSAGLERTGAIEAMGSMFTRIAGKSELRVMLVLILMAAGLSAFINNTPVVVVFMPIVLAHARATGLKASKLLIPLSFASILGGTCTLIGTSTNLVVDGISQSYGEAPVKMFEITKLGIVYAIIGTVYLITVGRKLLPARSSLAELLEPQSERHFLSQFVVEKDSSLIGKPLTDTLLKQFPGTQVLEVRRRGQNLHTPINELKIREMDRLLVTLPSSFAKRINETDGIRFLAQANLRELETRELKLVEGIIGPRSDLAGQTLEEIGFRRNFGVQVLAIHRQGANLRKEIRSVKLDFGDTLLMEGPAEAINRLQSGHDFITITEPPEIQIERDKMWIGVGITLCFVIGASLSVIPVPALAIIVALAMVLFRAISIRQAYEAIQWSLVFLIFGMLALGLAMEQTGAAAMLVNGVMRVFGGFSPYVVLAVVYLLSSFL
ncbi:MAG: SLC13 family permease, partial [Verrucomicrobiae bacterium]|nr:SLC13 family permease [Verrucomicrobiae bacterium]